MWLSKYIVENLCKKGWRDVGNCSNPKRTKNLKFLQYTVFRKAYILSGSGFYEFLYSIIESLNKICDIAEFIPNQLRFHKKALANSLDMEISLVALPCHFIG